MACEEQFRRLLILMDALWDAREELCNRLQSEREDMDWQQREKFDEAMEDNRRVFRRREDLMLNDSYNGEAHVYRCTPEERDAVLSLALRVLEGELSPEHAVERLWTDGFPTNGL